MLNALSIRNLAVIETLDVEFEAGFTALTGETGAGKSILLAAVGLALGGQADRRLVRHGADRADVRLSLTPPLGHPVFELLGAAEIDCDARDGLILRRTVRREGPSRAYVNDQPVTASCLAELGARLIDIQGQGASYSLSGASRHGDWLDRFGGHTSEVRAVGDAWARLVSAREALSAAEARSEAAAAARAEHEEIVRLLGALAPECDEVEQLERERSGLAGLVRAVDALREAGSALGGELDARLGRAARAMTQAERAGAGEHFGPRIVDLAETLEQAIVAVQTVADGLEDLAQTADHAMARREEIETRLGALRAAARRSGCDAAALPGLLSASRDALDRLEAGGTGLAARRQDLSACEADYRSAADALSTARQAAGDALATAVTAEMSCLSLGHARFRAALIACAEGPNGAEHIRFEVATAPGAAYQPIATSASGGELARIALALNVVLSGTGDAVSCIFDEADQGVGGAVATAIGDRFSALGGHVQTLAITHSPQVAARADGHVRLSKTISPEDGLGRTGCTRLDEDERRAELARMLSGRAVTKEAQAAARKLLEDEGDGRKQRNRRGRAA